MSAWRVDMNGGPHKGKHLEFPTLAEAQQWAGQYRTNADIPAKLVRVSKHQWRG